MILGDTHVSWLDMHRKAYRWTSVAELFKRLSMYATWNGANQYTIELDPGQVKVQDWYGWTDLVSITRIMEPVESWWKVTGAVQSVTVSAFELIPVYNPADAKSGFHGDLKYGYVLKNPEKMIGLTGFRHQLMQRPADSGISEFVPFTVESADVHPESGYSIVTRSGSVTANCIRLFTANEAAVNDQGVLCGRN